MTTPFTLAESVQDGQALLIPAGPVDLDNGLSIRDRARHHLLSDDIHAVVVDLSAATGIDNTGVGVLLDCRRKAITVGKTFRVRAASTLVAKFLRSLGVTRLLEDASTTTRFRELPSV